MSSIKVTQIPNFTPTIEQLNVGDLLINSYDGNIFIKQQQNKNQNIINLRSTSNIVTKIIAGSNITISPASGVGVVTINASTGSGGSGIPGGLNTQIQYNNAGVFGGSSNFTLIGGNSLYLTGSLNVSGSTIQRGNNTLLGNTTLSGSIIISGSTTPGNPTASVQIYGDIRQSGYHRFDPVTTNITQATSASYIYVSGSTNDLYFAQNSAGYSNTTRLRWIEGNMYTGLLSGGVLSSTPGSTTFNLTSGSGIIVTLNATTASADPYPTIQYLSWGNFINQSITNISSAKITYISVNSAGNINQSITPVGYSDPTQWDNQIEIGVVLHLSGSVSTGVYNAPQVAYGQSQRTDDFIRAFGPVKVSGHTLQASGSSPTLSLKKSSGVSYNNGSNYVLNPNHPSTVSDPAINTSKIYRYYISGSTPVIDTGVANAGYTAIDSKNYVDTTTGTLTTVGAGFFSIQRVFWIPNSPTNAFIVYYGNARYGNLVDATNAKDSEPFLEAPNTAQNAIFIGYIIIQGGGVGAIPRDLLNPNEATIIQGGLFRNIGGVGTSGTTPAASTLAGLTDVSIATKATGDLFFFSGSLWYNTKQLSGSYGITGSLNATSFTGSLFGTSSWSLNTVTASYVITAQTASYVLNAISSSFAVSSSRSVSSSFALTSSFAVSSSSTISSSYATNAGYAASTPTVVSTLFVQGYLTGNQSILNNVDTTINFERQYDPNLWLDLGTRKFIPTVAGYYSVSFGAWLENPASPTNQVNIQIRKNGSTVMIVQQPLNNGTGISLTGNRIYYMNGGGDYLDFTIFQGSGAPRNLLQGGTSDSAGTWFSAHLLTM